jgi:hypothetical protein
VRAQLQVHAVARARVGQQLLRSFPQRCPAAPGQLAQRGQQVAARLV